MQIKICTTKSSTCNDLKNTYKINNILVAVLNQKLVENTKTRGDSNSVSYWFESKAILPGKHDIINATVQQSNQETTWKTDENPVNGLIRRTSTLTKKLVRFIHT